MGQDPAVIREQIEQTREHMGETVDALGYKADVPSRTKEAVADKVGALRSKIGHAGGQVSEAAPDADDVKETASRAAGVAQENPLGLAVGAAALGFLAGMMLPGTRVEDERVGPMADRVKGQALEAGQEALEHGRQVARETGEVASQKLQETAAEVGETAKQRGQEHAQDLAGSVTES
jgi:hypothetical protein